MICFPNAKINLGLNIVEKRPDGYHNLETIFYPVPLKDALEIVESPVFSFSQTGIAVDACPEDNLVVKALRLLEKDFSLPELAIHLLKAIPFGAGLGGGSSDAAYMLKLLNEYCSLGLSVQQLEEKASVLGADCPFFIRNTPVFAKGTGNLFEPVDISLSGYFFCLVKPEVIVSTPEAYSLIKPAKPAVSLKEIVSLPIHEWKGKMVNDFEEVVFQKYPFIRGIKEELYSQGALYAAMSGSGSSVFGIFEKQVSLKEIFSSCYVWEGELL